MISKENIIEKIIACYPWTEQFAYKLEDYGFQDPKKAWNGFISLAKCVNFKKLYPGFFSGKVKDLKRLIFLKHQDRKKWDSKLEFLFHPLKIDYQF